MNKIKEKIYGAISDAIYNGVGGDCYDIGNGWILKFVACGDTFNGRGVEMGEFDRDGVGWNTYKCFIIGDYINEHNEMSDIIEEMTEDIIDEMDIVAELTGRTNIMKITNIQHSKNVMCFEYRGREYRMTCAETEQGKNTVWYYYIGPKRSNNVYWVSTRFIKRGTNDPVMNEFYNMPKLTERQMEELANDYMVNRKKYGNG